MVPSYLYLWLFGASSACGDSFLGCVRTGNIALYLAAAPFLYFTALRYTGRRRASLIALLSTLAPMNVYTLFFMPEASYYLGFCVLSWILLAWPARAAYKPVAAGVVLGALSLVKVHALFLLLPTCLYLLYASWQAGGRWQLRGLGGAVLVGALTAGVKFALGYLLAGPAGLSLLGPFYASSAGSGADPAARMAATLVNARGHLMALAVLLGLPLALMLHGLCSNGLRNDLRNTGTPGAPLQVYVLLMLGASVGMTAVYAGTIAHLADNEALRLHLRYYNFTFPLLWMVAAAAIGGGSNGDGRARLPWLRWAIALPLALLLAASLFLLPGYVLNMVDGPDIAAVMPGRAVGYVIATLQLAMLLLWAAGRANAPRLFLTVFLPLTLILGQGASVMFAAHYRLDRVGDRAGLVARQLVPPGERGQITLAGAEERQLLRAQFHIDHPGSRLMVLDNGAPIEQSQPQDQKWMLVIGEHVLPPDARVAHKGNGFTLLRRPDPAPVLVHVSLAAPNDPRVVAGIDGLAGIEHWGRWSSGERVAIRLARPLPRRFTVRLRGHAFGPNADLPFLLQVGAPDQAVGKEFRLGSATQWVSLDVDTSGNARDIVIVVPRPLSPAELGQGTDVRRLGIALEQVIVMAPQPAP
jgi:phosphoglycerol transferase